jgi:GNAT superfamily N-acetyltransferase
LSLQIISIPPSSLAEYARIPIRFEVTSILQPRLIDRGLGGILLDELPAAPYLKDYDLDETPANWPQQFNLDNWGFFLAYADNEPVGAAAVAFNTGGVHMLEGRPDLAVLWDIRVRPEWRGRGVGKALFWHAADWSRGRGCTQMKIETQNVNVSACRFYQKMGCELGQIHRYGYAAIPQVRGEVMLCWYLGLE